jgi:hypothetical protein
MHLLINSCRSQGVIVVPAPIDRLVAAVPWFAGVVAAILAVFTIYIGIALAAALFHPEPAVRSHASQIVIHLLRIFWPSR